MAMKSSKADGAIIHMLLGKLKEGDIPADVRNDCIREMVKHYFEPNSVEITGYGFDMLYAGPRSSFACYIPSEYGSNSFYSWP